MQIEGDGMEYLLEVKNLKKYFPVENGFLSKKVKYVKSIDGISFKIKEGETLGLVGESGCGKSTTGRTILRLHEPTSGEIYFNGEDITKLNKRDLRKRRKDIQIIFQDPYSSLNPRLTAGEIIGRAIDVKGLAKGEREEKIIKLLETVGLGAQYYNRYPNEFSGGQRQRIGIARALACNPKLIICDEPISALDVSIQAQIINLLQDIQKEFKLTYVFIAHNLAVVRHISDNIAVMYLGKIVEIGKKDEIFDNPKHPYTRALLSAILVPNPTEKKEKIKLEGDVPSPLDVPKGCRFWQRCPMANKQCEDIEPELKATNGEHLVACHYI